MYPEIILKDKGFPLHGPQDQDANSILKYHPFDILIHCQ
jgi:hypothetical protein